MKKGYLRRKIRYYFDCVMAKGTIAMSIMLFAVTALVIVLVGIVAALIAHDGVRHQIWLSFMHIMDSNALFGDPTDNILYLLVMGLATLCGMFLTSILIGIVASGIENKIHALRKGNSVVQEERHTVIIGFDNMVYSILQELVVANENKKRACVVVLGRQPKEEMEEAISAHIPDAGSLHIVCRSGNLYENYALERCSIETCKSVIVNSQDDAETVKILLALSAYVRDKKLTNPDLRFVASLQDDRFLEPAQIAGEGWAEIVYAKDAIARIIANTCRQHGLSQVFTELFNFAGNELYFERIPELVGKTFHEALLCFSNAVLVGIFAQGEAHLNPPMDMVIGEEDQLILFEEDDGAYCVRTVGAVDDTAICDCESVCAQASDHLSVFGSNDKLPIILSEYAKYVQPGTRVIIVDDDLSEEVLGTYDNLEVTVCRETISYELLSELRSENANNILLLNDDSRESEESDTQTLLNLVLLRNLADKTEWQLAITTEMRSVENQRLAKQARVDDFVIGSNFACLLMAQISENPLVAPVIVDLLDEDGSELYMKPASDYVALGTEVDAYTLTESAARKGEIFVGYRQADTAKREVVVNPDKGERVVFGEHDQIVVIAEQ